MTNQLSAARSTSSRNNTKLFVAYVPTRPLQQRKRAPQQQQSTPSTPHILLQKNHPPMRYREECIPLVSSVDTVCNYHLCVAQLENSNDFAPCFLCRKVIPCLFIHPPHAISQTKNVCVINIASVCVLLLVPTLLARVQTMSMCRNSFNTTLEAGDATTRDADVWLFLAHAVIVITTSSF